MTTPIAAITPASSGERSAGTTTLEMTPSTSIADPPAATNVAPIVPPISACDEDDGSPNHHVPRFQAIAPTRPPNTTSGVTAPASTIPPATVAATSSEMNAPMKLRIAATVTAIRGDSAPVATVVAIALAVSWKPLVKSNPRAVTTTTARMISPSTGWKLVASNGRCDQFTELQQLLPGVTQAQ